MSAFRAARKVYLQARNYGFTSHWSNIRCSFSTTMSESDGHATAPGGESIKQSQRDEKSRERSRRGGGNMPSLLSFFSQPAEGRQKRDRQYYEKLSIESKRALYTCGKKYLTLQDVPTWQQFQEGKSIRPHGGPLFPVNLDLNQKVSIWQGDITCLEIDAIVNAANSSLLGGGGVDGAIHRAAGYSLRDECSLLGGCSTGDSKLTSGHRLPSKYILHTVGPMNYNEQKLRSCYTTCLKLVLENNVRSVAFPCVATGVYGFPNEDAAHIALDTVRSWLETDDNADKVDRVIFCVFLKKDYLIYQKLLFRYFPPSDIPPSDGDKDGTPPPQDDDVDNDGKGGTPPPVDHGDNRGAGGDDNRDGNTPSAPSLERSVTEPVQGPPTTGSHSQQHNVAPHVQDSEQQNMDQQQQQSTEQEEEEIGTAV